MEEASDATRLKGMMEEASDATPRRPPKRPRPAKKPRRKFAPPLLVGCRVSVKLDDAFVNAKILKADRHLTNSRYFVHYLGKGKSFNRWAFQDAVDMNNILYRRKTEEDNNEFVKWGDLSKESRMKIRRALKRKLPRNLQMIEFNQKQIVPRHFSPYPRSFTNLPCAYFCPFCLHYFGKPDQLKNHLLICPMFEPPGKKIYHDEHEKLAVFEVDGSAEQVYCEKLGLFTKLFLKTKSVKESVKMFHFYVLCEEKKKDEFLMVGYFSRAKDSYEHNVSCLLVIPTVQNNGYGKFLIEFSYLLSKCEETVGTPEKPLSAMGMVSYASYWLYAIIDAFMSKNEHDLSEESIRSCKYFKIASTFSVSELSKITSIAKTDLIVTLRYYNIVRSTEQLVAEKSNSEAETYDENAEMDLDDDIDPNESSREYDESSSEIDINDSIDYEDNLEYDESIDDDSLEYDESIDDGDEENLSDSDAEDLSVSDDEECYEEDSVDDNEEEDDSDNYSGDYQNAKAGKEYCFVFTKQMIKKYIREKNEKPHPKLELMKWKPHDIAEFVRSEGVRNPLAFSYASPENPRSSSKLRKKIPEPSEDQSDPDEV
uniref:Histone acetyltransferase n=1 Tax=Panagrolaimus sp. PS1159 TaxID=55785 RepID=A0AC35FRE6_9BILA